MNDAHIDLNINNSIFEEIRRLRGDFGTLQGTVTSLEQNSARSMSGIGAAVRNINLVSLHQGFQNVAQGLNEINQPGLKFTSQLADVQAITGVAGKDLDALGAKARASAKEFGGSASESLESYKTILSRLGPEIGKSEKALSGMERNSRILSKTMGNDMVGATDALTTAVLQYGVDLSNPIKAQEEMGKMMNIMAAGAQEGAAEVTQISAALKVTGVAAKQAKVSFAETNAALQALAAGGKEGSDAGIAMRNVLQKMAGEDILPKEAADKLRMLGVNMKVVSDTSLPFTTRLRELKKATGDATIMAQVFGGENAAAANILIDSVDAQDKLTKSITGTNTAEEQAKIVMESRTEQMARQQAKTEDVKIAFFEATGGATAYLQPLSEIAITLSAFTPIVSGIKTVFNMFRTSTDASRQSLRGVNSSLSDVGNTSNRTSRLVSGFGSALKGIGWAAIAAGVAAVGARIWDVASGANEARIKLEEFRKGEAAGSKSGEKYVSAVTKDLEKQLELNKNLETAGKITADDRIKKEIELRKQAQFKLKDEIEYDNYRRVAFNESYQKQKKNQKEVEESFWNAQATKELLGIDNEATSTARKRGALAEVDAKLKVTLPAYDQNETELNRLLAEQQGQRKKAEPLVSPTGYDQTEDGIKEQIKLLKEQKGAMKIGTPEYLKLQGEIVRLQGKIKTGGGGSGGGGTKEYNGAGAEVKNINVKIDKLSDITIHTTNMSESPAQIRKVINDALTAAVRDFEAS